MIQEGLADGLMESTVWTAFWHSSSLLSEQSAALPGRLVFWQGHFSSSLAAGGIPRQISPEKASSSVLYLSGAGFGPVERNASDQAAL